MTLDIQKLLAEGKIGANEHRPGKYIIFDFDTVTELLRTGHYIVQSASTNALWIVTSTLADTPWNCGWSIKQRLTKLGLIEEVKRAYPVAYYGLSKHGSRTFNKKTAVSDAKKLLKLGDIKKKREKIDKTLVTTKGLPPSRHSNTVHQKLDEKRPDWWPRTFAVYRYKDFKNKSGVGFVIHGVVFRDGKTVIFWENTGAVATYDSFTQFEDVHLSGTAHGENVVVWSDERKEMKERVKLLEKAPEKEEKREAVFVCFYCNQFIDRSPKGRKPWRYVCNKEECQKKYGGDKETYKELKAQGLED